MKKKNVVRKVHHHQTKSHFCSIKKEIMRVVKLGFSTLVIEGPNEWYILYHGKAIVVEGKDSCMYNMGPIYIYLVRSSQKYT